MKNCLDEFCKASGQQVNFDKSSLYCSPNTDDGLAIEIRNICGSPLTSHSLEFLWYNSESPKRAVVDKVQATWKSQLLSMAGRLTLIQAVTSAVPIYTMQTAKLPVGTCEDINKINRKGALNLNLIWLDGTKFVDLSSLGSWDLKSESHESSSFR